MSTVTKIEWADRTWNPMVGCDRVSPGCDRCYAMGVARVRQFNPNPKIAQAFAGTTSNDNGVDWTGRVNLLDGRLTEPLGWKKPAKIFVNSMSDLFHKDVPVEFIAKVFAVMALTPQHTYQILTKRHARMRSVLSNPDFEQQVDRALLTVPEFSQFEITGRTWPLPKAGWPLPNVHLGVSVENQKWADIRIPALLDTPAAVRWVSAEPLLGPVDLTKWMLPVSPVPISEAPASWEEWEWPDWVPAKVREAIEGFWGPKSYRKPADWFRNMHQQGAPAFGSVVTLGDGFGKNPPMRTGRFVHAWNNIGRLVLDDGSFLYTSFHHGRERRRQQLIKWVVVGGESGPGARAMHPNWARSLRDQCVAADVPFLFKQWGEWAPAPFVVRVCDPEVGWQGTDEELAVAKADSEARGATHVHTGNCYDEDGERKYHLHEVGHKPWSLERCGLSDHEAPMRRWGKKRAGRELDGRTWDQYPSGGAR
jgi:protein gp37